MGWYVCLFAPDLGPSSSWIFEKTHGIFESKSWKCHFWYGCFQNGWWKFHGKPYENGWFGDTPIFGNTHTEDQQKRASISADWWDFFGSKFEIWRSGCSKRKLDINFFDFCGQKWPTKKLLPTELLRISISALQKIAHDHISILFNNSDAPASFSISLHAQSTSGIRISPRHTGQIMDAWLLRACCKKSSVKSEMMWLKPLKPTELRGWLLARCKVFKENR